MNATTLLILGLLGFFVARLTHRLGPTPWRQLHLNQKLLGILAILCALFILSNPEYLAFGFIGDSAFFDLLVLLLGIQMRCLGAQGRAWIAAQLARTGQWAMSPRLSYLLLLATFMAVQDAVSAVGRWLHLEIS